MAAAWAARAAPQRTAGVRGSSSDERPLVGGALKKIAPAPGKPTSPEENIQNAGELRRSLRSREETIKRPLIGVRYQIRKQKNARKRFSGMTPARLRATKHSLCIILIEIPELIESLT